MGNVKKRDLIIALGFGIMMGMVNLFSHRILEIDFRSQELLEIQAQGGKRMAAADYLRGHPLQTPKAGI